MSSFKNKSTSTSGLRPIASLMGIIYLQLSAGGSVLAAPAEESTVIEVDDAGKGDYDTIQEAINAANPGDTILVHEHSSTKGWQENLLIDKEGLTLIGEGKSKPIIKQDESSKGKKGSKGDKTNEVEEILFLRKKVKKQKCPKVYLDGCNELECGNTIVTIDAPGVSVENFFFRNGLVTFTENAHEGKLANSCLLGNYKAVIRHNGEDLKVPSEQGADGITIEGNFFQGGNEESIILNGNNHIVHQNVFIPADNGIKILGDGASIIGNTLVGCNARCINYIGSDAVITYNNLLANHGGISQTGDNPTISHHRLESLGDDSIRVDCGDGGCSGGMVSYNHISGSLDKDYGIRIKYANSFEIEHNEINLAGGVAVYFEGNDSTIRGNIISRSGANQRYRPANIEIRGNDNVIEENELYYSTFSAVEQVIGDRNVYHGNKIKGSGHSGIEVQSGTGARIEANDIEDSQGEGIAIVGGTAHTIIDNVLAKNQLDICWDDSLPTDGTVFQDNDFQTGSILTTCVVAAG